MYGIEWLINLPGEDKIFIGIIVLWIIIVIASAIIFWPSRKEAKRDKQQEDLDRQCGRGGVVLKNEIQRTN